MSRSQKPAKSARVSEDELVILRDLLQPLWQAAYDRYGLALRIPSRVTDPKHVEVCAAAERDARRSLSIVESALARCALGRTGTR